jgi:hypothetical protein
MNELTEAKTRDEFIDELELAIAKLPLLDLEVVHRFTEGMYIRELHIPAGVMVTTMTHKTQHPFVVSKGIIKVSSDTEGSVTIEAPHTGITEPNTRRAAHAVTDTIWTTFHVTDETDPNKIAEEILEPKDMSLISAAAGKEIQAGCFTPKTLTE